MKYFWKIINGYYRQHLTKNFYEIALKLWFHRFGRGEGFTIFNNMNSVACELFYRKF